MTNDEQMTNFKCQMTKLDISHLSLGICSSLGFRHSSLKSKSGFTLIELIMVIAIISILLLFAGARLDFLIPTYSLRSAARQIGSLMKTAKVEAAMIGKDIYMEYDIDKKEYWLLVPFEKEKEEEENMSLMVARPTEARDLEKEYEYQKLFRNKLPDGISFVDVIFTEGEKTTYGKTTVKISPYGFSNFHIVNLKNSEGEHIAVKINGLTGTLTFYDSYKEATTQLEDTELQ